MADITVKFKDGSSREFKHEGRSGGSFTKSVKYEGGFVIITDEWYDTVAFPAEIVAEVSERADRSW